MDDSRARRRGTPFSVFECESIHPSLHERLVLDGEKRRRFGGGAWPCDAHVKNDSSTGQKKKRKGKLRSPSP